MENANDKTKKQTENVNSEHRARMREKFRKNKDSMPDHEIVEMLLYYAVLRRNTNKQAHQLLEMAGSLNGIFDLEGNDICKIDYLTDNSVFFFELLKEFILRLKKEDLDKDKLKKITTKNISQKLRKHFLECKKEKMIMITVDNDCNEINTHTIATGNNSTATISIKEIVRLAMMDKAEYVFLAHNHPSGILAPSRDDFNTTKVICDALNLVDISVIEHFIVTETSYIGILGKFKSA